MPTETQARDLLHRAAGQLEVGPPPVDALLETAPTRRRRRFVTMAGGLVAAAGLVAVGIAVVSQGTDNSPTPSVGPASPMSASPSTGSVPSTSGAAIVSVSRTCGATDGPALDVVVESDRRLSMYVVVLDGERVLGKRPAILRPGRPTHIMVDLVLPTDAEAVTLQVVPTRTGIPIAQLGNVPLEPAAGAGLCG